MMLVYQCSHAQDFLVTSKGDTLQGKIRPFNSPTDPKVQITVGDEKKVFRVLQTQGYRYKDELYAPVKFNNRYVFMKVIKPGYLTLYGFQMENQITYDGRYLGRRDGTGMEVPNLMFKKATSKYLADCPEVSTKIEQGTLGKQQLEQIVDQYNECMSRGVAVAVVQTRKLDAWDVLEEKVKSKQFDKKDDALEMITEIKLKITRHEKIPSFMVEGLKNSLSATDLSAELNNALNELKN